MDERLQPLMQSVGRAVLAAAAFERVLLVDIAQRRAASDGLTKQLQLELATLERKSAGTLLHTLREIGIEPDLAERIRELIEQRNWLVHHFMEDLEVFLAFVTQDGFEPLVERVDAVAAQCQALVNEIAPPAFSGAEHVLGATLEQLLEGLQAANLDEIKDPRLRAQLEMVRNLDVKELESLRERER